MDIVVNNQNPPTTSPFQSIRAVDYTVIFVRDMVAMRRFYEDVLCFPLTRELSAGWIEYQIGGNTLALARPNRWTATDAPTPNGSASLQLAFKVAASEVDACADELVRHGGTSVLAETPEIYGAEHLLTRRAVSHEVAQRLGQTFRIPARKINVVYNGVPISSFNRPANAALRIALTGSAGKPIVLTTARLAEQKGLCYLLKAAALVPEAIFVLAGEGPERANLEAQAGELGLNERVLFVGYRQDVPDLLASCDLFVLPSLFEGLPLSILEAMAANKPVVASAIGGNDEAIFHRETGLLVPPADPPAAALSFCRPR